MEFVFTTFLSLLANQFWNDPTMRVGSVSPLGAFIAVRWKPRLGQISESNAKQCWEYGQTHLKRRENCVVMLAQYGERLVL